MAEEKKGDQGQTVPVNQDVLSQMGRPKLGEEFDIELSIKFKGKVSRHLPDMNVLFPTASCVGTCGQSCPVCPTDTPTCPC